MTPNVTPPDEPGEVADDPDAVAELLDTLAVDPSFVGGQSAQATVRLTRRAPAGGATVALSSDRSEAQVPASITIAEGETSIVFAISSQPVTALTPVRITASLGGTVLTADTELRPLPALTSISPREATRGQTVEVTLTGTHFVPGHTNLTVSGGDITVSNVSVVSHTELTAVLAIHDGATVSDRDVTVQTSDGTTNAVRFAVRAQLAGPPPPPPTGSETFNFTGAPQQFVVPAGVTEITIDARGAQGGSGHALGFGDPGDGGLGGRVVATIAVTPLEVLTVYVGGRGADAGYGTGGLGGFNGGGNGASHGDAGLSGSGGGGGGASDVRRGVTLADRLVVAGGGGGGGGSREQLLYFGGSGGAGGGLVASAGQNGIDANPQGRGEGGSQVAGGSGGISHIPQPGGDAGVLGQGGHAAATSLVVGTGGGGGGGGYYGGGGAGASSLGASGGGGGSSFAEPTASNVAHQQGVNTGDGVVIISW